MKKGLVALAGLGIAGAATLAVACVVAKRSKEVIEEYYEYFDDETEDEQGLDDDNELVGFGEFGPLMSDRCKVEESEIVIPVVVKQEISEEEKEKFWLEAEKAKEVSLEPIDMDLEIESITKELLNRYPIEWQYNSMCSLWGRGLHDKLIKREKLYEASEFYGTTWYFIQGIDQ